MVERVYFKKRKKSMRSLLTHYTGIYSVDSEVSREVTYGVSEGKFAIICSDGVAFCPFHEAPQLAAMMKSKKMRDEILDIYEDVKDLKRMEVLIG